MLNNLRNVAFIKVMMWVVAGAFIGLIVVEWGADYGGRQGGAPAGDTVGVINGQKIEHRQFDQELRAAYQQAKAQNENAEPDLSRLIRQTWDQMIARVLVEEQIEKYQITVSDKEIDFINRNQPLPQIQNLEFFQTEGSFDPVKYAQFLDDPSTYSDPQRKQFVLNAEELVRQAMLTQKLQEMVVGGVKITAEEVRQAYIDKHEKVRVGYTGIQAASISDSLASVPDNEIQTYYNTNKDEFQQDAAISASFVSYPKEPSETDQTDIKAEIYDLAARIHDGASFADLARTRSDDPGSATRGGDLGFFRKGQMVKAFEDTAFSLAPGKTSQPFHTRFGWHILKVEERKGKGDSLQVHARHILLRVAPSRNTLDSLRMNAETFLDRADEKGFDAAVQEQGLTPQDTGFITAGSFFPLLGSHTASLVNFFLESSPGALSTTYDTDQGFHVFVLKAKRAAGPRPLEEVRSRILSKLQMEKKVALAQNRLAPVLSDVRSGKSLSETAKSHGLEYTETEPFSRTDFIPNVGGRNAFVGTAFRLSPDQISDVVATDRGAYILRLLERQSADEKDLQDERGPLAQQLMSQKRNEVLTAWFNNLKEKAKIEDNRHQFYTNF
ncbi:MAG: peptidylprolyl isomerase [bacterium]|nr:peptidylprolyl isomerase [bacterium]